MAFTDKPESANEAQDHSQPLDEGGYFSLNDVIAAGRHQITRSEHLLAAETPATYSRALSYSYSSSSSRSPWALPLGRFWPR